MKSKVCGDRRMCINKDSSGMRLAVQECSSAGGNGVDEQQGWVRLGGIQQLLHSFPRTVSGGAAPHN